MGPIRCQSSHTQPCRRASRARRVDERPLVEPRGGGWHHTVPSSRRLHGVPVSVAGRSAPECTSSQKVHFVIRVVLWLKHFTTRETTGNTYETTGKADGVSERSPFRRGTSPRPGVRSAWERVVPGARGLWGAVRGWRAFARAACRSWPARLPCWCVDVCAITETSALTSTSPTRAAAGSVDAAAAARVVASTRAPAPPLARAHPLVCIA